jgi:hypothetical protein
MAKEMSKTGMASPFRGGSGKCRWTKGRKSKIGLLASHFLAWMNNGISFLGDALMASSRSDIVWVDGFGLCASPPAAADANAGAGIVLVASIFDPIRQPTAIVGGIGIGGIT